MAAFADSLQYELSTKAEVDSFGDLKLPQNFKVLLKFVSILFVA